jgi:nucleoside-diphosphate-sugar epimerase
MPGLNLSWENLELYLSCNVSAVGNLIEYSKKNKIRKIIHASTSSVYGINAVTPEKSELNPCSPYGVSKLMAEKLILSHFYNFDLQFTILRFFSVYGPRQRPDMAYSKICNSILNQREFLIYGDGTASRTNTYVTDAANAAIAAIFNEKMSNEIFNISGSEACSLNEVIQIFAEMLGQSLPRRYMETRPGDQRVTKGNISKIKNLGIEINTVSLHEGLKHQALKASEDFRNGLRID